MPAQITQRAQSLEPGTRVELLEADLTSLGGSVYRFHNSTTQGAASITWQTNVYTAYPLKIEGFEYKGQGTLPRPHLHLSNVGSAISGLCRQYKDCVGAKITRHVTFQEFLDGQPGADPTQEFLPDIFYVDRKVNEINSEIEFELVSAVDLQGIQLPLRQIASNNCAWLYRGTECTYAGVPVQDDQGNALVATTDRGAYNAATTYAAHDYVYVLMPNGIRQYYVSLLNGNTQPLINAGWWTRDWCRKTLTACKARFGATGILPFGAFPGVTALPRL